jgi:hypothetical protein
MWHPAARRVIPRRQFRFLICAGLTSALVLLVFLTSQSAPGQTPAPPTVKPTAGGLVKLIGDDEKRANALDVQIENAMRADGWDEAIVHIQPQEAHHVR